MDQDGRRVVEERQGLNNPPAGVHQGATLVGEIDVCIKMMIVNKLYYLVTEMMKVDDKGVETMVNQVFDVVLKQWLASHFDEGLGAVLGQFLQTGAQAGGEKHGGLIHGDAVRYG